MEGRRKERINELRTKCQKERRKKLRMEEGGKEGKKEGRKCKSKKGNTLLYPFCSQAFIQYSYN